MAMCIRQNTKIFHNVYSHFIHNSQIVSQNLEMIQMSFHRWMNKQILVYLYNWVLHLNYSRNIQLNKKEYITNIHNNMDESHR